VASNEGSLSLSEFATNLYKEATGNIPHRNDILKWNFLEISQHPALKVLGVPSCCSEYLVLVSLKDAARIIVFSLDSGSVPLDPNDISKYENVLLKMLESLQL